MSDHNDVTWDRWEEVDALLGQALESAPPDRAEFLRNACGDDLALLKAVSDLVEASAQASEGVVRPGDSLLHAALAGSGSGSTDALTRGDQVGPYRIVEEIGRGGMATVYRGERADGAFQKTVAVKVLRRGLDTDELVRRFLSERQILSGLTHPNIATLLDGGATDDGRPFLVMELVEGDVITDWAEKRGLAASERVRLFLQVVEAVEFAHSHMVVHRDLKPSNVLVTDEGKVKLLDFGVAKLMERSVDPDSPLTQAGLAPLTPECASPEQLRGGRITATSDVFQLGALLFWLLTGQRLFSQERERLYGVGDEAVGLPSEAICDNGTLRRALQGDLDTIIRKALRTDPGERYRSAEAFAADLRRHLEGQPITARAATLGYRLRKFTLRNPWFFPALVMIGLVVAGYIATLANHSNQMERERNEAQAQAERAEALRAFLINQFEAADPYSDDPQPGRGITVVEAMASGAVRARTDLAGQPLLQAEMLSTIAGVYGNLNVLDLALDLVNEAMSIRADNGADDSPEQAEDLGLLARILGLQGQRDTVKVLLETRLERERAMFGPDHGRVAYALEALSAFRHGDGEYSEVLRMRENAIRIRREAETIDNGALSSALADLADSYRRVDRWDDALAAALEAHQLAVDDHGEEHPRTAQQKAHLAQVYTGMTRFAEAEELYQEAIPVLRRTLGERHSITLSTWNNLGILLDWVEDFQGAEAVHREVLALAVATYGTEMHFEVAGSIQNLAAALLRQGRLSEADSLARVAEGIYRSTLGGEHYLVAYSMVTQGEAKIQQKRGAAAEAILRQARTLLESHFGTGFPTTAAQCRLGRALALQGRFEEAEPLMESALENMELVDGVRPREIETCAEGLAALYEVTGGGGETALRTAPPPP